MANLESTLVVAPQTESLLSQNHVVVKAAIIFAPVAMLAALLLCLSTQGAPEIDLSVLAAP